MSAPQMIFSPVSFIHFALIDSLVDGWWLSRDALLMPLTPPPLLDTLFFEDKKMKLDVFLPAS